MLVASRQALDDLEAHPHDLSGGGWAGPTAGRGRVEALARPGWWRRGAGGGGGRGSEPAAAAQHRPDRLPDRAGGADQRAPHARSATALVRLTYGERELTVQVDDDRGGVGTRRLLGWQRPARDGGRVAVLGGRLEAGLPTGGGFRVSPRWPWTVRREASLAGSRSAWPRTVGHPSSAHCCMLAGRRRAADGAAAWPPGGATFRGPVRVVSRPWGWGRVGVVGETGLQPADRSGGLCRVKASRASF
jgi:hypothetical protein